MSRIKIVWLEDTHDCDVCGTNWAQGAEVYKDGQLLFKLEPMAHCLGGQHWDLEDIYKYLLQALGYEVEDDNE